MDGNEWMEDCDRYRVKVCSTAYDNLGQAERIAIDMAMGWMQCATVRAGMYEQAIEKLLAKCQREGVVL